MYTKVWGDRIARAAVVYILISEPGQPFQSQFVLYRTDIKLIKQTINRTSRCNKVDAVRLYASYRLNLLLLKGQRCMIGLTLDTLFRLLGTISLMKTIIKIVKNI